MLIARWQIDARFGHKQEVISRLQQWAQEIAPQVGMHCGRLLTGSIGALEATVVHDWEVADLTELDRAWQQLAQLPAHAQWGRDLEPFVVSGTARWEIYRVI
ncbi:hypothetical protein LMG23992_04461 [Cupriavidus laharis]|uniref:Dabb family protein n=1 Tax=Cupriavidus laharis TaxID=151654 RepID=A0ABN7Z7Q1_9BURK|nr:hypothetical protein [Cupriavidus laharis]CAG9181263.1 hypothetical protein LMG23992_04461 [Cupriavidus laharis]